MGAAQAAGAKKGAGRPALPPVSVAKFKDGMDLLEQLVLENRRTFIEHGQAYKQDHRDATLRDLTAEEAASLAAGFPDDPRSPEELAAAFLAREDLRAYDDPVPLEVLGAAGVQLAPALMKSGQLLTALIELPDQEYEEARETGRLREVLDEKVLELDKGGLRDLRERAAAALNHLTDEMGVEPGKAFGLLWRSVWQALSEAVTTLIPTDRLTSSSSTASLVSTDGLAETSSTEPATATPVA